MRRRDLLGAGAAAAPLIAFRAAAAPDAGARLLVVFLRGAYDAASVLPPISSGFYYRSRPNIAIGKPDAADPGAAIRLDADWGLHPALRESIYPLWQAGQVAFVSFAGTDDMSRSHFATQDTIELGQPIRPDRDVRSGFMGRLAGALASAEPIAFTPQVPLIFQGSTRPVPNVVMGAAKPRVNDRESQLIAQMYGDDSLGPSVASGFAVEDALAKPSAMDGAAASRGAVSARGFEGSARRIARLMRDKFNVAFLDVGGWDTHVDQGGGSGYLARHLSELGRGLAGYADEMGPDWKDTVLVVISEFGRTFRENGDKGTDHGHGTVYWVMGGSVRGGRVLGDHAVMAAGDLNENRDYPVLIDYRALFGGLFRRMYGLDATRLAQVFPQMAPRDLNLI
jgi:uncharacterized protein (DUF1501 family)